MENGAAKKEGLRERKRRQTLQRIAETGLKLFLENGYEATTLEAIAAAAGISARTFFYYFKTKDEVLHFWQGGGFFEALRPALLAVSPDQGPLDAVRDCLLGLVSCYETEQSLVVDRLLRSTEALRKRKQVIFAEMEESVFEALCEVWPQPERREALRTIAMVSVGTMRLGMDAWREDGGNRPMAEYIREGFFLLRAEL